MAKTPTMMSSAPRRYRLLVAGLFLTVMLSACSFGDSDGHTFTLYRNSVLDAGMRIHVATFDANDKDDYNRENCEIASKLFQAQPSVTVKYWCEKGRYRK